MISSAPTLAALQHQARQPAWASKRTRLDKGAAAEVRRIGKLNVRYKWDFSKTLRAGKLPALDHSKGQYNEAIRLMWREYSEGKKSSFKELGTIHGVSHIGPTLDLKDEDVVNSYKLVLDYAHGGKHASHDIITFPNATFLPIRRGTTVGSVSRWKFCRGQLG